VSTIGSALALKLAKRGSEAMIAVDPNGETNWRCQHCSSARGSLLPPLEIPGSIFVLRSSPAVFAIAAIRLVLEG